MALLLGINLPWSEVPSRPFGTSILMPSNFTLLQFSVPPMGVTSMTTLNLLVAPNRSICLMALSMSLALTEKVLALTSMGIGYLAKGSVGSTTGSGVMVSVLTEGLIEGLSVAKAATWMGSDLNVPSFLTAYIRTPFTTVSRITLSSPKSITWSSVKASRLMGTVSSLVWSRTVVSMSLRSYSSLMHDESANRESTAEPANTWCFSFIIE